VPVGVPPKYSGRRMFKNESGTFQVTVKDQRVDFRACVEGFRSLYLAVDDASRHGPNLDLIFFLLLSKNFANGCSDS